MSSTYLEQLRGTLSSIEVLEKTVLLCMSNKQQQPNQTVILDHRISNLLQMIQKTSADALILIDGADGWKKEELNYLSGGTGDPWDNFYERFKEIKEYHKKAANIPIQQNKVEFYYEQAFAPPFKEPYFSGEEHHGRHLDLYASYKELLNLRKLKESGKLKVGDYLWYLQHFFQFHEIPLFVKEKEGTKYRAYLNNLLEYMRSIYSRVNPLLDPAKIEENISQEFERQWSNGLLKGWDIRKEPIDKADPLYCQVCQKLFGTENTFVNHFQGKKHKTLAKLKEKNQIQEIANQEQEAEGNDVADDEAQKAQRHQQWAQLELSIVIYKDALNHQLNETMNQVRKKQSRGYDENDEDGEHIVDANHQPEQIDEVSSDEDSPIYNPKNLPLGWDGRPIPYWLYKLHGLGVEYKCEICGNTSYWGRKAFEDHFQGWRHSYGMRCLKIPNTLHFKEITKIQDAINLFRKIQNQQDTNKFKPEYEEEYEDTEGNLLTKKTYYDLKKQGLL